MLTPRQSAHLETIPPTRQITDDFADYADIVFKRLGDRVKMWTTFANPYSFCMTGYGWGTHAPGRCDTCPGVSLGF